MLRLGFTTSSIACMHVALIYCLFSPNSMECITVHYPPNWVEHVLMQLKPNSTQVCNQFFILPLCDFERKPLIIVTNDLQQLEQQLNLQNDEHEMIYGWIEQLNVALKWSNFFLERGKNKSPILVSYPIIWKHVFVSERKCPDH